MFLLFQAEDHIIMNSPVLKKQNSELPNPLSHPNINNPFRQNGSMKMPLEKNFGLESFKNGMTSSTKDERRPEESLSESKSHDNSATPKSESADRTESILKIEDPLNTWDNLQLPDVFKKYTLTTDVPFKGVRTSIITIQPDKSQTLASTKENNDSPLVKSSNRIGHSHRSKTVTLSTLQRLPTKINLDEENQSHKILNSPQSKERPSETFITNIKHNESHLERQTSEYKLDKKATSDYSSKKSPRNTSLNALNTHTGTPKYNPQKIFWKLGRKKRMNDFQQTIDIERSSYLSPVRNSQLSQDHLPDEEPRTTRSRDFQAKKTRKMHLFEGIPYVPYDVFLRQDIGMQNVMFRDLLKILLDKCKTLKNFLQDTNRMKRIYREIDEELRTTINFFLEETIGLLNAIGSLVMQEFRDSIDKIGIKSSPLDNPNLKLTGFVNETEIFMDNCELYIDSIEHLRDCIDCYFVMCRQKDRKPLPDHYCFDLLEFIARSRFNLGQLMETFRIIEKNIESKIKWKKEESSINQPQKFRTPQNLITSTIRGGDKPNSDTYKLLNELLQNKFNISKNKLAATRESKVILNQEAEDEKFLSILQNQKQLKKKSSPNVGDNRKLIILNRLLDPVQDPQIKSALKIARDHTRIQVDREVLDYMSAKPSQDEFKVKINTDLPIINNLQKIVSNPKLRSIYFSPHKESESHLHKTDESKLLDELETILNKKSPKPEETKEVITGLVNSVSNLRHFACLLHGEILQDQKLQKFAKTETKLPDIKKVASNKKLKIE